MLTAAARTIVNKRAGPIATMRVSIGTFLEVMKSKEIKSRKLRQLVNWNMAMLALCIIHQRARRK